MFFRVRLGSLVSMMSRMRHMASRTVGVVGSFFVASTFVMLCGFGMMLRGVSKVLRDLLVMFRCFL